MREQFAINGNCDLILIFHKEEIVTNTSYECLR